MPKSKRNKIVNLTKVKSKNKDHKLKEINKLKSYIETYDHIYFVKFQNLNNKILHDLRENFDDTKFVFTKHSIAKIAFGDEKNKFKNGNLTVNYLKGEAGIIFTKLNKEEFEKKIKGINIPEYANPGTVVDYDIEIEVGEKAFENISSSMDQYLRKLGVSCKVINGKIFVEEKYLLSQKNTQLSVSQSKILKLLKIKLSVFKFEWLCYYNRQGSFNQFN